tara:strand:- start:526 stop:1005 length:480 start_codon:yes stop_codon:yes gene_type:complete
MKLIEDLNNKKIDEIASRLQLADHMVTLFDMWLQKEGTKSDESAEFLQRLLMSMPTHPQGALVRVRNKIVDMVEDDSPVLQKMDGKDGFFEKINKYAEITGVKVDDFQSTNAQIPNAPSGGWLARYSTGTKSTWITNAKATCAAVGSADSCRQTRASPG